MMIPSSESRPGSIRLIVIVWLSLLSTLAVIDHLAWSRLSRDIKANADDTQLADLQKTVSSLEQALKELTQRPASVSEAAFTPVREVLEARLTKLERGADGREDEVSVLQSRLQAAESRIATMGRRAASTRPVPSVSAAAIVPEPPFAVLGIEMRGGERVLAIAPNGPRSLAQIRLLRVGDSQDHWQLSALEGSVAGFLIDGRLQRVKLP